MVEGDFQSVEIVKNFKTLKSENFMQKNYLKVVFKGQCKCTWSRKVLKTLWLLNTNIKNDQEVKKKKKFKLQNTFSSNFQPKKKKKRHLCISSYAIKEDQINPHAQSHVLNLAKICV